MIDIYDCKNRLICKGNPVTGFVETKYQKQVTRTRLQIHDCIIIERDRVLTKITRIDNEQFKIESKIV